MTYRQALDAEITARFILLREMDVASDEYKAAVEVLTKLINLANSIDNQRKDNIIKVIGILIPASITVWGTLVSLNFETTGIVTSLIGRGYIQRLLPKK